MPDQRMRGLEKSTLAKDLSDVPEHWGGAASFWGCPEGVTGTRSGIACGSGITKKKIFALSRSLEKDFSRTRAVWKCTDYFTELPITGDIQAKAGG